MKVLINVTHPTNQGGVAKYFRALDGKFYSQVQYFTIGSRFKKKLDIPFLRIFSDYIKFYKITRRNRYEIIHLNPSLGLKSVIRDAVFLVLAPSFSGKIILFWHGWNENFYASILASSVFKFLFKRIFFKSDAFIVLDSDVRKKFREIGYRKDIYLETTLIDDSDVAGIDINYDLKNNDPQKKFNILFLSRIIKEKGIYEAIDAYNLVRNKYPNAYFIIAGAGSELNLVKDYVKERGISGVTFTGYITGEEKKQIFLNSDVYLFPSYSEGMPISVLEAMAFGLPVISTKVGGIKDFFINKKMGFLVEKSDPISLADHIVRLIKNNDLRLKMSIHNYIYSRENFLASEVVHRLESIYRQIYENKIENKSQIY